MVRVDYGKPVVGDIGQRACASSISTYCPLHVKQPCSYWSSGQF